MNTPSIQSLLAMYLRLSAADRFDAATRHPGRTQTAKLLDILGRNASTEYGRRYGFASVRSVADFQRAVPATDYDVLEPLIERVRKGDREVLTAERPSMFATSSGTTGRAKYIPVTPAYLREYSHAVHVHMHRLFVDFPDVLQGQALVPSSSDREGHTSAGIPYGAISGYLTRTQPGLIKRFYVLPYALSNVKDVDAKYYLTLRAAIEADVRMIVMPNPSSLILLAEKLEAFADELIFDVRRGSVHPDFESRATPAGLQLSVRSNPTRAAQLADVLRRTGRLLPRDVWPNLRVISCWKGGTMPLYLRRLPELYGDCPVRDLGYMASEGRGGTPLVNSGSAGVLAITSHFFEFVPEDQIDRPDPVFYTCDQLEPNRQYYVYFTTSGGLYRYHINDVIRVVDFYHDTPVIQFVRKGQGISSITGEKLTESQMTTALLQALDAESVRLGHFTACVALGDRPAYAFYIEGADSESIEKLRRFARNVDRALCINNAEYEAKRLSQRLGPPSVRRVAAGSYEKLRQLRVAAGAPEAQVKIPQLSPNLRFGEQLQVVDEIQMEAAPAC
jgi:hypothetical protein